MLINTLTYGEPSAFEQNTRHITRGCGRAGTGAGAGACAGAIAGVLAEVVRRQAVRRHQAEIVTPR